MIRRAVSLRNKLALLTTVFALTLCGSMAVAVWCVEVPFAAAASAFRASSNALLDIARLRGLLLDERQWLADNAADDDLQSHLRTAHAEQIALLRRIVSGMDESVGRSFIPNVHRLLNRKDIGAAADGPLLDPDRTAAFIELDALLNEASVKLQRHALDATAESFRTRREVITILSFTTAVGVLVAALGMLLMRRWVLTPVAELQSAAQHIAAGNLSHRVPVRTADELGRLSDQVNRMTVALTEMQRTVAQQERLAATGEMISYVAHNIRNPLAGIRGLAEAALAKSSADAELREQQQLIIESVDRFQQWLRGLEHSVRPLEIHPEAADPRAVVEGVLSVFRPMAQRRKVGFELTTDAEIGQVEVDVRHFEQALAAVVGNAIEASPAGASVIIKIGRRRADPSGWYVSIADRGPGIDAAQIGRVFDPYFTTKPGGTGMGLALARRIVELHGGRIEVGAPPHEGSVFRIELPDVGRARVPGIRTNQPRSKDV